jgi:hypothetical protein
LDAKIPPQGVTIARDFAALNHLSARQNTGATKIVQQAFRILPMLEAHGLVLKTICLPVLGTGGHGLTVEGLLQPILDGAKWALRVLKLADRVCFAEINLERANKMSDAMDDVLGRVKVTVA